jgi:hypothetical protein
MKDISHDRFVAHLDILGMSAIVGKDHDEAWEMLSALVDARDSASNTTLEFIDSAERVHVPERIRSVTFSDTIFLFTIGATDSDLRALVVTVTQIFYQALFNKVPIRAGIAFGTLYVNFEKSMYAGPALIDAYEVGESAQWLGIVFSKSLQGRENSLALSRGKSSIVVDWPVPLKQGAVDLSVVNWPAAVAHNFKVPPPLTTAQFYEIFEPTFGPISGLPQDVIAKYANTVDFINFQYAAHEA